MLVEKRKVLYVVVFERQENIEKTDQQQVNVDN